jgi:hypothetical protein
MIKKLKKESILPRLDGIKRDVERLYGFAQKGQESLKNDDDLFSLAQFHLRQA